MRILKILAAMLPLVACVPPSSAPLRPDAAGHIVSEQEVRDWAELHERYRAPGLESRRFTHQELWNAIEPVLAGSRALHREEIGRSAEGRPLYLVRYGSGPTRVLLWSQMHGDESTASMALADIFRYLAASPTDARAARLAERLTILTIPMLNPDGAERFQRRNALGIDVNRDARSLATPEGQALKQVRDRYQPRFGFNLHDQNVRITVGEQDRIAAYALLAPPYDEARSTNEVRLRAMRVAAVLHQAAEPLVGGYIAQYDDSFNPRAFGDLMQQWGTSTVLIESGGWRDDPEKQYLRKVNFVTILAALDAIATGSYALADPAWYESLPFNGSLANDLVLRGGTLVLPGRAPYRADLAVNFAEPLERRGGRIADAGDLREMRARDTLDVSGLFLHPEPNMLERAAAGAALSIGASANLVIRRAADPASEPVWNVEGGVPHRVP